MPERPRIFLDTKTTDSSSYVDLLSFQVSLDAKGICFFSLGIDPDPNALYEIHIAHLLDRVDLELTAMWGVTLAHLTSGIYQGFKAGDIITVRHKSNVALTSVKTGITCALNEVVGDVRC